MPGASGQSCSISGTHPSVMIFTTVSKLQATNPMCADTAVASVGGACLPAHYTVPAVSEGSGTQLICIVLW